MVHKSASFLSLGLAWPTKGSVMAYSKSFCQVLTRLRLFSDPRHTFKNYSSNNNICGTKEF